MAKLKYLSSDTVDRLRASIADNLEMYRSGDFTALMAEGEWNIELGLDVDLSQLQSLGHDNSAATEVRNSRLVWGALGSLKPSLSYEEGIWVRLTHVECLRYARSRWLDLNASPEDLAKKIELHFFARTLSQRRDDNAVSRLWFNGHIAHQTIPDNNLSALDVMIYRQDSRLSLIERSLLGSRPALAIGIVRAAKLHPWIKDKEGNFREFMKAVNLLGGGRLFEAMPAQEVDEFFHHCAVRAGMDETPAS